MQIKVNELIHNREYIYEIIIGVLIVGLILLISWNKVNIQRKEDEIEMICNEVRELIDKHIKAFNAKDVDTYISTIDVQDKEANEEVFRASFKKYDFRIAIEDLSFENVEENRATLNIKQAISDGSNDSDKDYAATKIYVRKVDNDWKIFKTEAIK